MANKVQSVQLRSNTLLQQYATRKAAAEPGISRQSVQWTLKTDLNLYPYKMILLPKLTVQNKNQRMAFAEWAENNEVWFNNVWFSDEAHFHLDGVINKQSVQFWASENLHVIHEKVHHALRIAVWVAVSSHGLLGPIFIEEAVNSEHYLSMFCVSPSCYRFVITNSVVHAGWSQAAHSKCSFRLSA
jgi:hypothetical protein